MITKQLRSDIFPGIASFTRTTDEILHSYILACQEAFSQFFKSADDVVDYTNTLKDSQIAELFFQVGDFYNRSKSQTLPAVIRFNMIISLVEKMQRGLLPYIPIHEFLLQPQNVAALAGKDVGAVREALAAKVEEYHAAYGSTRGFTEFFQKYLGADDKVLLAKSLKVKQTKHLRQLGKSRNYSAMADISEAEKAGEAVEIASLPACYNWRRCYIEYGDCHPSLGCDVVDDPKIMFDALKKVAGQLYKWRNEFQHDAKVPPVGDVPFIYADGKGASVNEITLDRLQDIFEKATKRYFDQFRSV